MTSQEHTVRPHLDSKGPHGTTQTHKPRLAEDLLAFVTGFEHKEQP